MTGSPGAAFLIALSLTVPAAGEDFPAPGDPFEHKALPPALRAKLADQARQALVEVGIAFKPFDPAEGRSEDTEYYLFSDFDFGLVKLPKMGQRKRVFGVLVDADGTFAADLYAYDWRHVESVVALGPDGREHPARPLGIARRGRMMWFRAPALARALPPCRRTPLKAGSRYFNVTPTMDGEEARGQLDINPLVLEEALWLDPGFRARKITSPKHWGGGFGGEMVFTETGEWTGIDPMHYWLEPDGSWKVHPEDLAAGRLDWERWEQALDRLTRRLEGRLAAVHLRFRQIRGAKDESGYGRDDALKKLKERSDAGLPVGPRLIVVPDELDPPLVRRLESLTVAVGGRSVPARFLGVLKEFNGYLVETDSALEPLGDPTAAPPPDGELLAAHEVRFRGGRVDLRPHPVHFEGRARGYQDALTRRVSPEVAGGAVLSTLEGVPFGAALTQRRFESAIETESEYSMSKPSPIVRVYAFSELAELFADPGPRIDPLVVPLTLQETRKRVWLGVETQDVTPDLAKELGLERETHDATRGQLVTFVYPGSPAGRLGIAPGDVVLKVRDLMKKDDIPVPPSAERRSWGREDEWWREWFVRRTPLTETLERFRPGARVQLTWARGQREKTADLTLEEGPPDFESAPRVKDDRTGLTVKEITYDVRQTLRYGADVRGVLVHEVEPGSPADVADIDPPEIVEEIDGRPVTTLEDFAKRLAQAAARRQDAVRMRVRMLNDSRYVDLKFAKPGAEKGEGKREEGGFGAPPDLDEP